MISVTQQGLEDVLRYKLKASLSVEYLSAKSVAVCDEKSALFFSMLISSMANANGGVIFIGVSSSRKNPKNIEPINNKDVVSWLKMVCQTQIYPEIPDCVISTIEVSEKGEFVIGIQIPNSHLAPHMCADRRFYKRSETKAVLLEEYEIRDLYTKGKRPEIELFSVTNTGGIPTLSGGKFERVNFYPRFLVKNTGGSVERFYKVELSIPSQINNPNFNMMADNFSRFEDGCTIYSFVGKTILFQGEIASVVEPNIIVEDSTYECFENGEIVLKFFYSSGIQTKSFRCKELFLYRNKQIEKKDFSQAISGQ
ncbi:MAG: ATP-binding protein [Bacteroidales bacterium]|nr:ATP-binding protein [Bacteroidales bacterium]